MFNSIEFLLFFLPIFLLLYALAPDKIKNMILLSGSLIFYTLGELKSLPVLAVSVFVNYIFGLGMGRGRTVKAGSVPEAEARNKRQESKAENKKLNSGLKENEEKSLRVINIQRENQDVQHQKEYGKEVQKGNKTDGRGGRPGLKNRVIFLAALSFNIGLLAVFKYVKKSLPLGISFYTFQNLSYLIDVYRGEQEREVSLIKYAAGATMFPKITSGPIVRYGEIREALQRREFGMRSVQEGLKVFTMGMAAKILLADQVGLLWRDVQIAGFESISTPLAWLGAVSYSLMLYFDFYGYSLMAAGLGRMLGFGLPENFKNPYMAVSVRDFYRRWHMTLGGWFCRYIYIPLGGNRKGEFRTVCNLLAVWVLTAVWHGSTANFLIWGLLLWLAIVIERQFEALGAGRLFDRGAGRVFVHLYLWAVIPVTWMCFAITDVDQLQIFLGRMFHIVPALQVSLGDWKRALADYGWLLGMGLFACTPALQKLFRRFKDSLPGAVILAVLFWWCVWRIQMKGQNPFMYRGF